LPAQSSSEPSGFSVHVDPEALQRDRLAAAVGGASHRSDSDDQGGSSALDRDRDHRQAARRSSERARSGRATGAGGGRSYAFRRS
jgi:hypothetical protein